MLPSSPPFDGGWSGAAWALAQTSEERRTAQIFREATPAVVSVARGRRPGERQRRESAEEDGLPPVIGSGFLWDAEHVVTNYHVIRDVTPENLFVIFLQASARGGASDDPPRREVLKGQLVGFDSVTDTAVLRVVRTDNDGRGAGPRPLALGDSAELEVGQTVFAIGNPFGLEHSMSQGIISGISRTLDMGERPIRGCIQTDASINPGNSGGPLLDSQGRVIGMNTAILTGSGTSAGVGLAIPVGTVRRNVESIIKQGYVARAFLGMTLAQDEVSEQLQLPGVIVMAVVPESPAAIRDTRRGVPGRGALQKRPDAKAGVKPMRKGVLGDVVTALDGERVRTVADFFRLLDRHSPGEAVTFKVERAQRGVDDGVEELTLNATLSARTRSKAPK